MLSRIGVSAVLVCVVVVGGCGGGGSSSTTPPPPPPTITVAITGAPQSLAAGATVQLTATVANDSTNKGVTWSCAPANSCGSFNPTTTASGAATTYTAPGAAASVTITATSVASASAAATATVSITASQVSIAISGAPASLTVNGTASLTATVTNDSSNAGADWTCAPAGSCGSFNPAHTASGAATTYTAPAAAGSVTITVASTASSSVTATATITVNAASGGLALAAGNYAFQLAGTETAGFIYGLVGSITVDGNGNVTAGEQDFNDGHGLESPTGGDKITGGSYTLGTNGAPGTLKLVTSNTALGTAGTENFSMTLVNGKHALLTQVDAFGTAGGTLDLQTPNSTITGNYSFAVTGAADGSEQEVFGGLVQVTGAGTISVKVDVNALGNNTTGGTNTGTFTAPDSQGRATMDFGGDNYAVYIIGPEVLRIMVLDANRQDVGSAYGQGSGTFSTASLNGSFVFKLNSPGSGAASFASAGQFTSNGSGTITAGVADSDAAGTVKTAGTFTGTYTLGTAVAGIGYGGATLTSSGILGGTFGVYAVDPNLNILDPNNTSGGGGALLINLTAGLPGYGVILPQATPSAQTFTGNYVVNYRCFTPASFVEQNLEGQINVATGNVITGTADASSAGAATPNLGVALSGTATADSANPGRFTLPLTVAIGANPPTLTFVIYQASSGDLVWVETDTTQYVAGTIQQQ